MSEQKTVLSDSERLKQNKLENRKRFFRAFFSRKIVIFGAVGTLFFVIVALFAPLIATHDPNSTDLLSKLAPASAEHLLGTDLYGRDLFSRLVYGARVSIVVGVIATLASAAIGSFLGMLAAYNGGIVDKILTGACDTFVAIPGTALCMALIAVFGGGISAMAMILCVIGIPGFLRMMRASSMSIMNTDYILAARLSGESKLKIMFKHVLPNSISPIIVMATQHVGGTILMESGLSFLGIGISIPTASWGSIINEARPYLLTSPMYVMAPCICLALLIVSLNLLGDGIRDAMDPNLHGEV